ncbi:DUF814 domain-containing protein [Candidatus Woesearchaeota archaeon]|nr:MAG: RNA-binding protein snRNP-like protein [archaeon GW2011_AR4]MBS3129464.1 DUF814 domain-containing protein [Candidatus Woesearchaeota archaeon]HIH38916.1 DUF814 domain-containing protein [Candidatus Woesearchaeota archaeon]HIH49686.1 DUF814 domain-containing protein [Candidatus Woesearchaeota archaeon]HIJ03751.1 DUF814 domain-containing protein [Candidatus Woesearchaeota archaeon]
MDVLIDTKKTLDQNASAYFESAKKARSKAAKAKEALEKTRKELEHVQKNKGRHLDEIAAIKKVKKRKWYEKFRWFFTSDNRLVIGGRDATTNEIMIKKHTDPGDLVFHTDMAGSPFFVLKTDNMPVTENILEEIADATCSFSKAFQLGLKTQSVFYVLPEQVTKEAKAGEYLTKGAFMIKGKTQYTKNKINVAIGLTEEKELMCGPIEAIRVHCKEVLIIEQGPDKPSDAAKKIRKKIPADLDDIIRALPTGTMKVLAS